MSTLELQQIEEQLLALNLNDFQEFISNLLSKKNQNTNSIPNLDELPSGEPTAEEAKAIAEFEANPELASKEEVLEMEKKLGIKLNYG